MKRLDRAKLPVQDNGFIVTIADAKPDTTAKFEFPAGSMGPKVAAASRFAQLTGRSAVIGALSDLEAMVRGEAGTTIGAGLDVAWRSGGATAG